MWCQIIITSVLLTYVQGSSLLNWFWNKPADDTNVLMVDGIPLVTVPYESMTEDEKFLQEASKITGIQLSSPLEVCQHKVILKIKTSCSTMSEEELAKLSVNLLNCQSAMEGRQIYPCTESMSLKQCTTDMDADMWNAYHLISNRARAVCYATRSTQFRALTELTVNKLMQSAHNQLDALSTLKESHDRLEDKTAEALESITKGNAALLDQQQHLKDVQTAAHKLVSNNLRELYNEKALIRNGHERLAMMTDDIKERLGKASELLEDLIKLQQQAEVVWDKIESSTNQIVKQNTDAAEKYKQTLGNLQKINDTVHFIWNITDSMRTEFEEKLNWITDYIGDTGEQFQKVYQVSLHIIYLLSAMIIAAFLNAPFLTRMTIMGLIPINLLSFLKHGMKACLDFTSITVLIFLITGMHFVMIGIHRFIRSSTKKAKSDFVEYNHELSPHSTPFAPPKVSKVAFGTRFTNTVHAINESFMKIITYCKASLQSLISHYGANTSSTEELSCSYLPAKKNHEAVVEDDLEYPSISEDERSLRCKDKSIHEDFEFFRRRWNRKSPGSTSSFGTSLSRSVTPSSGIGSKNICCAITKSGANCRYRALTGQDFCGRHSRY